MAPSQKSEISAGVNLDIEHLADDTSYLDNKLVQSLAWDGITVTVPDRETKTPKKILCDVSGYVEAGKDLPF